MAITPLGLDVRAGIFDVLGTVVDWRSSIIEQCAAIAASNPQLCGIVNPH